MLIYYLFSTLFKIIELKALAAIIKTYAKYLMNNENNKLKEENDKLKNDLSENINTVLDRF